MAGEADFDLMNRWQRGFPLASRPFFEIGNKCGLAEERVIEGFMNLKGQGAIDRVGPVFRPNTVGASSLAAMAVPAERLERVAAAVSAFPGVNHNYEREHHYNLWFVVTASSPSAVEEIIQQIESATGLPLLRLPLLEEYHIDLGFDLDTRAAPRSGPEQVAPLVLTDGERKLVSALAAGLPLVSRPYAALGLPEENVLEMLRRWLDAGVIRRIGAVVRHRKLGYEANAMVVWDVPDGEVAAAGRRLAADSAITLCYRRPRVLPDWRYNLFCMVHGRERSAVLYEIKRMTALHGLGRYPRVTLFSPRCFSQRAARYG
jgi:DNA-binding Lrp family transcriptional regulator